MSLCVSECLCVSLSVSVCLCVPLYVFVCLRVSLYVSVLHLEPLCLYVSLYVFKFFLFVSLSVSKLSEYLTSLCVLFVAIAVCFSTFLPLSPPFSICFNPNTIPYTSLHNPSSSSASTQTQSPTTKQSTYQSIINL